MSDPSDDSSYFRFFNELGIVTQLAYSRIDRALPEGLSRAQFSVLNNFVRLGGTRSPSGLARAFQVTRGAMTNTLARLEAAGCVRIEASSADGRGKVVSITRKGIRLRNRAVASAGRAFDDLDAVLSEADMAELLPRVQALRAYLDTHRG